MAKINKIEFASSFAELAADVSCPQQKEAMKNSNGKTIYLDFWGPEDFTMSGFLVFLVPSSGLLDRP